MTEAREPIDAIPAVYRGMDGQIAHCRSRLECRWLVLLDALGVDWQYEPRAFDIDHWLYLPDLFLPSLGCWVEIKPAGDETRAGLLRRFAQVTGEPMLLVAGPPKLGEYRITLFRRDLAPEKGLRWAVGRRDHSELWLCSVESGVAVCLSERSSRANWPVTNAEALKAGYRAAMSWRFEEER